MAARSKRKLIIGILGLGVAGIIALVISLMASSPDQDASDFSESGVTNAQIEAKTENPGEAATGKNLPAEPIDKGIKLSEENLEQNDEVFIQNLREKYKNTIHNKWSQIKAIEKLMEYLEKFYPDDWEAHVFDFLKRIFPELADELYAQFQKNMSYRQWLIDNRQELNMLSREDRMDRLWDMRYQIFGEDAYEIWEVELKTEQIYQSLKQIKEQPDAPFEEKYGTYLGAVKQAYGDGSDRFMEKRRQELMDRFLSVESVQDDLYDMPVEERSQKLREFRKSMGLDEAALKRWDQLDQERDTEWDKGIKYTAARDEVASKYEDDELAQKLQALRVEVFGTDWADIIKNEEESGFYRFKEKRKLGME
jgi:hypothetical protein